MQLAQLIANNSTIHDPKSVVKCEKPLGRNP